MDPEAADDALPIADATLMTTEVVIEDQQQQEQLAWPVRHSFILWLLLTKQWQDLLLSLHDCIGTQHVSYSMKIKQAVPVSSLALCQEGCMQQPMISNV